MSAVALYPGHILIYRREDSARILGENTGASSPTDVLPVKSWPPSRYAIAMLSTDGQTIDAITLIRKGARLRTTTDKYHVQFDHLVNVRPITQRELGRKHLSLFKQHSQSFLNTLPPDQWKSLLTAVKALRPEANARIDELERMLERPISAGSGRTSAAWITAALERDALATAFYLSGFTPPVAASPPGATPKPALAALVVNPSEQTMLLHDMAQGLPGSGLEHIRTEAQIARFEEKGEKDPRRRLTVLNVNTTNLEDTLGVDLIYYRHDLQSFVLIQYKRMKKGAQGKWLYYPDGSYASEYAKMKSLAKKARPNRPAALADYRFHHHWNYFKFCPIDEYDSKFQQLIRGYYIPFDFWQLYAQSPEAKGERGGFRVTPEIGHLDTHTFNHLVRTGWIGSHGDMSATIGAIVREKIKPKAKTSLMIALYQELTGQEKMDVQA